MDIIQADLNKLIWKLNIKFEMTDNFLGEIRAFACSYAPEGWALCDGSLLPLNQNQALYSLLGTRFGGNGTTNFALPDLRGRVPIGTGVRGASPAYTYTIGNNGGSETVALETATMPPHNHYVSVKNALGSVGLAGGILAIPNGGSTQVNIYNTSTGSTTTLNPDTVGNTGAGSPHSNMQPFQTINFCIAVLGIYPQRP